MFQKISHNEFMIKGIENNGTSSFYHYVWKNGPSNIKSVLVMEDLSNGWKSSSFAAASTKDQLMSCLKNTSVLHAKYWKNQIVIGQCSLASSNGDIRPGHSSKMTCWMRERIVKDIAGSFEKMKKSEWFSGPYCKLQKDSPHIPDWLTIQPIGKVIIIYLTLSLTIHLNLHLTDDGPYSPLEDELVIEMLKVMNERYPEFYQVKAKEWVKRPPETLLHGDYHTGNHMFGLDENDGRPTV